MIYRGAKFDFVEHDVRSAGGDVLKRQFVKHPGAVVILPILERPGEATEVVFIRNFRHALGREIWELPAGTKEKGESPRECAARELEEETGYRAATFLAIGRFYTSPGLSDEVMYPFVARDLTFVGRRPEPDETMSVHSVGLGEIDKMTATGEIADGKSIVAIHLAARAGLLSL